MSQLILQYLHVLLPFILNIQPKMLRSLMLNPFLRSFYGLFCALKRLSNALRELIRAARTASVAGNTAEIALDLGNEPLVVQLLAVAVIQAQVGGIAAQPLAVIVARIAGGVAVLLQMGGGEE